MFLICYLFSKKLSGSLWMFLGFHDNFRLAILINFVLIKKKCEDKCAQWWLFARIRVYALCAFVLAQMFMKISRVVHYYVTSISSKFKKDPSLPCKDICKRVLTFKIHWFLFMYFPHFHSYALKNTSKMDNHWMSIESYGD